MSQEQSKCPLNKDKHSTDVFLKLKACTMERGAGVSILVSLSHQLRVGLENTSASSAPFA